MTHLFLAIYFDKGVSLFAHVLNCMFRSLAMKYKPWGYNYVQTRGVAGKLNLKSLRTNRNFTPTFTVGKSNKMLSLYNSDICTQLTILIIGERRQALVRSD